MNLFIECRVKLRSSPQLDVATLAKVGLSSKERENTFVADSDGQPTHFTLRILTLIPKKLLEIKCGRGQMSFCPPSCHSRSQKSDSANVVLELFRCSDVLDVSKVGKIPQILPYDVKPFHFHGCTQPSIEVSCSLTLLPYPFLHI